MHHAEPPWFLTYKKIHGICESRRAKREKNKKKTGLEIKNKFRELLSERGQLNGKGG